MKVNIQIRCRAGTTCQHSHFSDFQQVTMVIVYFKGNLFYSILCFLMEYFELPSLYVIVNKKLTEFTNQHDIVTF